MKQRLYLECYAGISGDMTVGALLDLGADEENLRTTLASLQLDGYTVEIGRVKKGGLSVCDFAVHTADGQAELDHDMEYLHGSGSHTHPHGHDHTHRGLTEVTQILAASGMTEHAKELALRIFSILAEAESKAHGVSVDEVHFHEVGAIDSIVDVAAAAICLDELGITDVIVPALWEGCGTIHCAHGILPIPVPATLHIVQAHGLLLHPTDTEGEFVTPTGAAIAAAVCTERELPACYRVDRVGLGGGKREYERPSILRAMLITPQEDPDAGSAVPAGRAAEAADSGAAGAEGIWKLECNIDDCTGEAAGYAMERLFAAGARDVHFTPVFMKKNRPGYLITVLCAEEDRERMEEILFAETTTIGVRRQWMARTVLPREERTVETSLGKVRVKMTEHGGKKESVPEYESIAAIAREKKLPYREVVDRIRSEL